MKTKILKLSVLLLLFSFITAGCQKDDIFELNIGDENAVIQKEIDGIEFKFCLLNEQGDPSTVFEEGENFTFHFSFKNLKEDTIIVTTEFVYDEFFRVYQVIETEHIDKGKPWSGIWCDFSLAPREIPVAPNSSSELLSPWMPKGEIYDYYPLCVTGRDALPTGVFITRFDLNFHYKINGKERIIDDLKFKINFEINQNHNHE